MSHTIFAVHSGVPELPRGEPPRERSEGTSTTYNADNEQSTFNWSRFSFDANGNLTNDGTYTYVYGNRNQLNQINQGITVVASLSYDGLGLRGPPLAQPPRPGHYLTQTRKVCQP